MKEPLVSIIVPVYKAEGTIVRCVNSLIHQSYNNTEILLVENNSPDSSGKLCDSFTEENIRVFHLKEKGVSKARNVGLKYAKGKYIAFCDSDDYYTDDHILCLMKAALHNKADVVISGYYRENKGEFLEYNLNVSKIMSKREILKNIFLTNFVMGSCCNKLFNKNMISKITFREDISIMEDTYFFLEVLQRAKKVYYEGKALYFYCENEESAVRKIDTTLSIDKTNSLYISTYDKMLEKFSFSPEVIAMINCKKFENAVWCMYLIKSGRVHSKELERNAKIEIRKDKRYFIHSSFLSVKYKVKILLFLYFPFLKEIKDSIDK